MSHANKSHERLHLDHESMSKLPSKYSQPPLNMANKATFDSDNLVYYAKYYRQILSSAPACALSVAAGAPLENIKTRMQSRYFTSALACTKYTYHTEGIRGFWVGTWAPLGSITASRALGFSIYRWAKYRIDAVIENVTGSSPLQHVNKPGTYPNAATVACFTGAGMISGGIVAIVLSPVELIKNAAQTSVLMASDANMKSSANGPRNVGKITSYGAFRQVLAQRGPRGLYIGFRLHLLRDVIGSGLYFGVYEAVKQSMNSAYGANQANSPAAVAFAGATCGVLAWALTYPLDTMKTQAQNRLVGAQALSQPLGSAVKSAASSATASLSKWKGFEMIILRSAVQNMIQMSFFEQAKVVIDNMRFSDGSKNLPQIERELGRDSKLPKNKKL